MNCIFCKIVNGEIPVKISYEDKLVVAFADLNPQAPIHQLIIPKRHIATLNDLVDSDQELIGHMILTAKNIAKELDIDEGGYRTLFNCNADAGQEVFHIHLHLLGGRKMHWPPG